MTAALINSRKRGWHSSSDLLKPVIEENSLISLDQYNYSTSLSLLNYSSSISSRTIKGFAPASSQPTSVHAATLQETNISKRSEPPDVLVKISSADNLNSMHRTVLNLAEKTPGSNNRRVHGTESTDTSFERQPLAPPCRDYSTPSDQSPSPRGMRRITGPAIERLSSDPGLPWPAKAADVADSDDLDAANATTDGAAARIGGRPPRPLMRERMSPPPRNIEHRGLPRPPRAAERTPRPDTRISPPPRSGTSAATR